MTEPRWLVDSYLEWVRSEGVPVLEGLAVDLLTVETEPWARMGARGAYVHLDARGDFLNTYVCEIPPGGATEPQQHLFEEVVYVLDGHGTAALEAPDGSKRTFEWGTGSLFALPLNMRYRFYNGSGQEPARLAAVTNLPLVMNLFRNERFIFANLAGFPERLGGRDSFRGDGTFMPVREHRHMWETNFVPDLRAFDKLQPAPSRGYGSSSIMFVLADGTMHAHMSEMPVGTYKKGHRHPIDFHIIQLTGHGYSLYWYEGDAEFIRIDWRHGLLHAPPDQMFHQHFNTSAEPARYLAIAFGGLRYPFTAAKRSMWMRDSREKKAKFQIDYADQDPRIHQMFLEELRKHAVELQMPEVLV